MDKHILIACSSFNMDSDFMKQSFYRRLFSVIKYHIYEGKINNIYFDFMNEYSDDPYIKKPSREILQSVIDECKEKNIIYKETFNTYTTNLKLIINVQILEMRYDLIVLLGCGFIKNILTPEAIMSYNYMTNENGIICIVGREHVEDEELNFITVEALLNYQTYLGFYEFRMTYADEQLAAKLFLSYFNPSKHKGIPFYVKDKIINENKTIRAKEKKPIIKEKHLFIHQPSLPYGFIKMDFHELYCHDDTTK